MFLSNVSVRRPVAMACLIIGLSVLGVRAWRTMGLELLPKIDLPYVTIVTVYPGASPTEIETDVAKRVEDAVTSIDGLKHVMSVCMEDVSQTLLEFQLDVDVDVAANDVREKLDMIVNDLPSDAERPQILKFDVNATPIISLAVTGDMPLDDLYDYADNQLRDRLSVISGVADVDLIGGSEKEVQVQLDRSKLAARGLTTMGVVQAVQQGVQTVPSGRVRDATAEYSVKYDAEYRNVADIGNLEVANRDGARCYLSDLGTVSMAAAEQRQAAYLDGKPCIGIRITKKADANAVKVVDAVRAELDAVRKELPGGVDLQWVADDGTYIRSTTDSATSDIAQGVLLTALVLFLFLYEVRSTVIVAVTMPLTIVVGLFFMSLMGYTLNVSTLLAIGLSVGILVTNSIVVMENIVKRLATAPNPAEAARIGAGEVAIAVGASAGTNAVVLFPIAMMKSRVGLFFTPFAFTMVIVTAVSLFISFTLTPILCALMLRRVDAGGRKGVLRRVEAAWNRLFDRASAAYARFLSLLERHKVLSAGVVLLSVAMLAHALWLAPKVGFTFMPDSDRGELLVKLEYPTRYNLQHTIERVQEAEERLKGLPGLEHIFTNVGKVEGMIGQASEGVNLAQVLLKFKDKTERRENLQDLLELTRSRLAGYPDAIISVASGSSMGGQSSPVEFQVAGQDLQVLDTVALDASRVARGVPGVLEPDTSVREGKAELRVQPRRAVLSDLGLPSTGLGLTLRANIEGIKAAMFKEGARTYDIRVKLAEELGKEQVEGFQMPGVPGYPVLLTSLADVRESVAPVQVTRYDKQRVSKMYANLAVGKPLGTAIEQISTGLRKGGSVPPGYRYEFVGLYEVMQEGNTEFIEAGLIAIVLTYLLLAAMLESFTQPFIILVTLPLGLIGVIWSLYATGQSISMFVLLGAVMLIGIVVNNAILIMDQTNTLRKRGLRAHEAMVKACAEEFRPIAMITLAAVLGMVPLAFGRGIGSELRNGIGIASIGGILISAILTLLVVPVLYDLLTRDRAKGRNQAETTPAAAKAPGTM